MLRGRARRGAFCAGGKPTCAAFSGKAGPGEYQTLADLPPIPPSFDEPANDNGPGQENSP